MSNIKEESKKQVPLKNYVYLFCILLGSLLLLFYIYRWYETYNENKLYTSIMNKYLTVINYNELNNYITETPNTILYVSILGDKQINRFEEQFKNSIANSNLRNNILYLDITNEEKNDAMKKLNIDSNFPYLVVYTNGKITDTYSIGKNNYSTKKTIKYLNRIGADESD
ncbi:MAG: hypothetical protein PUD25_03715 [Bacilli bacterium]|nr:hypothetical protein [Bacilli bacterium]